VQAEQATRWTVTLGAMTEAHWLEVRAIYQAGIDTGHATYESTPTATWANWQQNHLNELSLVALHDSHVVGWASLTPASGRCVYAGVAEVSVYVSPTAKGRGVGRQLLAGLIEQSEVRTFWTLQAGIFPENVASLALHQAVGFRVVGVRHRLAKMTYGPLAGRWRDVLFLERRSSRAGID
jgi:L-amino acid N-acyltransferase YncA